MKKRISHQTTIVLILILFFIVYGLISFVNHYNFRTYALDLGLYTNAMWDYIHFQFNDHTVTRAIGENQLADHFDLYLMLFSPFSLLFKSYTLLIIQIASILTGGYGVYRYFEYKKNPLALWAMVFFLSFFGVISAVSYDYHSNVITAMAIPWFFLFFDKEKYKQATLLFIFLLIGKENMPLWIGFVCLGMIFNYYPRKKPMLYLGLYAIVAFISFIMIIKVVMPYFTHTGTYQHFTYSELGSNNKEALIYLLTHPTDAFILFFSNFSGNPSYDMVKPEFFIELILSGILLLFVKPQYLIMLIPIFFQKMFSDRVGFWSIHGQYNIEFAPILAIGIFTIIHQYFKKENFKKVFSITLILLAITISIRNMHDQELWFNEAQNNLFYGKHYTQQYDVKEVYEVMKLIPDDAAISTQTVFQPHLALRDKSYTFPIINDAQYLLLSEKEGAYPLYRKPFLKKLEAIKKDSNWRIVTSNDHLFLFKRDTLMH